MAESPSSPSPVEIDAALAGRLIAAQFPQWAQLPVRAVAVQGWDNRTFRLGEAMSVRLPSARRYVAAIEKEHAWLPRIAPGLPLPIPVPLALGEPGENYPWRWSVNRWLAGEPAATGPIGDRRRFAADLAAFLAALHRVDAAGGPPAGRDSFWRGGPRSPRWATGSTARRRPRSGTPRSRQPGAARPCGCTATWRPATCWSKAAA